MQLNKHLTALTVLLVAQTALFYSASHGENTPLPKPLASLPYDIGPWRYKQEQVVDADTRAILKADDIVERLYLGPEGGADLFIAYFQSQRYGQSPHSPKNCLPGSGFQPVESGKIDVPVGDRTIQVNRYVVSKGDYEEVVLYWYQSQGRVIADEFSAKFYLVADSIKNHRSDTSLVRVVVPVLGGQRERSKDIATHFVQAAYPVVDSWLPR